jgi:hypothetical protein
MKTQQTGRGQGQKGQEPTGFSQQEDIRPGGLACNSKEEEKRHTTSHDHHVQQRAGYPRLKKQGRWKGTNAALKKNAQSADGR